MGRGAAAGRFHRDVRRRERGWRDPRQGVDDAPLSAADAAGVVAFRAGLLLSAAATAAAAGAGVLRDAGAVRESLADAAGAKPQLGGAAHAAQRRRRQASEAEVAAGQVTLKPLRAEAEQQTIPDAELETFLAGYLTTAQSA